MDFSTVLRLLYNLLSLNLKTDVNVPAISKIKVIKGGELLLLTSWKPLRIWIRIRSKPSGIRSLKTLPYLA